MVIDDKTDITTLDKQSTVNSNGIDEAECLKNIISRIGIAPFTIFDKNMVAGSYNKQILYNKRKFLENHVLHNTPGIDHEPLVFASALTFLIVIFCFFVHFYYIRVYKR